MGRKTTTQSISFYRPDVLPSHNQQHQSTEWTDADIQLDIKSKNRSIKMSSKISETPAVSKDAQKSTSYG